MSTFKMILSIALVSIALGACQSPDISFPAAKLYPADDDTSKVFASYLAPAGSGPFPGVVLLHTCEGLKPHVTDEWPNYLTGLGYAVLTVDTYGSHGYSSCDLADYDAVREDFVKDAYGALNYFARRPEVDGNRVALMGFSLSANTINRILPIHPYVSLSKRQNFKAAIAVYGSCPVDIRVVIPYLQIIPEHDGWAHTCIKLAKFNPLVEAKILPDAYPGFDDITVRGPDNTGIQMQFSSAATDQARNIIKAFLAQNLGN